MPYLRLRQVCLAAPELETAEQDLIDIFGLAVGYRDGNVARYGLCNVLLPVGKNSFLEVVAPTREGTAVDRFLAQPGGAAGYMIICDCNDAERRRVHAESMGIRTANLIQHDGRYLGVQLHPRDTGATMVEFCTTPGGEDPLGAYNPAGPNWQQGVRTEVTQGWRGFQVSVPDPQAYAQKWSQLFELPVEHVNGDPALKLDDGYIRFTQAGPDGRAKFDAIEMFVADPSAARARAKARGRLGADGEITVCGVRFLMA